MNISFYPKTFDNYYNQTRISSIVFYTQNVSANFARTQYPYPSIRHMAKHNPKIVTAQHIEQFYKWVFATALCMHSTLLLGWKHKQLAAIIQIMMEPCMCSVCVCVWGEEVHLPFHHPFHYPSFCIPCRIRIHQLYSCVYIIICNFYLKKILI